MGNLGIPLSEILARDVIGSLLMVTGIHLRIKMTLLMALMTS
jgi:hypothetical protein